MWKTSCLFLTFAMITTAQGLYDYTVKRIDGTSETLSKYKGKIVLLVNVASKCGYTPQYSALEAVYTKYEGRGLVILGFPANNFMSQEPGTNAEIQTFCTRKYNVTFPMFSKISVSGGDQAPLYGYLTGKSSDAKFAGPIQWNFTKFLINRDGQIIGRFEPAVTPDSAEVTSAIESALR